MLKKFFRIKKGTYDKIIYKGITYRILYVYWYLILYRYEVLKFAFETLKESQIEQQTIDTLEMAMWKSCILIGPNNVLLEYEEEILKKLKTELLSGLNKLQVTCTLADANEGSAAEYLINKLIDAGKLDLALRISTIFNYKHRVSIRRSMF